MTTDQARWFREVSEQVLHRARRPAATSPPRSSRVGRRMHEEPNVPNEGSAGRGLRLRPGPVIAVEAWFMAGGDDTSWTHDDGWSMRTAGGSRAAHVMHTVAVTYGGPRVLTTLSRAATSPSPGRS